MNPEEIRARIRTLCEQIVADDGAVLQDWEESFCQSCRQSVPYAGPTAHTDACLVSQATALLHEIGAAP
jgi:hypothetical protein